MNYLVVNLKEKRRPHPEGYKSWIDYWEHRTGQAAGHCHKRIGTCMEDAKDGAHVQLKDSENRTWYIAPTCHFHNMQLGATYWVEGPLVPVDPENPNILW